eukprot:CAMPEP_0198274528 /NCGR_PEP_ID=MMETSP1447-20131203/60789_1 /TAXON_ID=420782 /ORGANISM="Chaetoceros dichaeta, Strain CCMP1751" /LENGTH=32 /DNA_ID= /DNA_START= /DNA_END= /DNA_ORIENTATION=
MTPIPWECQSELMKEDLAPGEMLVMVDTNMKD